MKKEFLILAVLFCVFGNMVSISGVFATSPCPSGSTFSGVPFNQFYIILPYTGGNIGFTLLNPSTDNIKPVWKDSTYHKSYHVQITITYFKLNSDEINSVQDNFNVDQSQKNEVNGNLLYAPDLDKSRKCSVTVTTWDI